jgi:UDPglucose 6-dehydrogenase
MKIGIIGLGFVGLSLASVLGSKKYRIMGFDLDKDKSLNIKNGKAPFYEPRLEETMKLALKQGLSIEDNIDVIVNDCKLIFITVGTPQKSDGSIDLTMIKSVIGKISQLLKNTKNKPAIIIKSTVVPNTTLKVLLPILNKSGRKLGKEFGLITNPEFLRESMSIHDTENPHIIVLGGIKDKYMNMIKEFYQKIHRNAPIIITNNQTAELIKYTNNSFLATKISFINQISNICQSILGANVEDVAKAIGLDPRIGPLFLNAGPGYGGSCLPKDVKAIINFSQKIGIDPILLNAVETVNDYQLKNLVLTIKKALGSMKGKKITIFGLAFKPDTDDVRDSISIKLIKRLLENGVNITVHDPKAIENAKKIFGGKISYAHSIEGSLKNSECGVIVTPWKEYSMISEKHLKNMKTRIIVDSRRILSNRKLKMRYYPIGIG